MVIIETELAGVLIVEPRRYTDTRGYFCELFRADQYREALNSCEFVQDNMSRSQRSVVRGLHLQFPNPQGKLVFATAGWIRDVAVDVRCGSPTFGKHVVVELSENNGRQLWIPRGFAHGFSVLSDVADVVYKCDGYYNPVSEQGINWSDPALGIDWGVDPAELSPRDASAPYLADVSRLPNWERIL